MAEIESPMVEHLPEYLGFGDLDCRFTRIINGTVYARYSLNGELVYEIEWSENKCELEEYFEGKLISVSFGKALGETFLRHWHVARRRSPRLSHMVDKIVHKSNIYFRSCELKNAIAFYPAGIIFNLYQPVIDRNRKAWATLKSQIVENKSTFPLHLVKESSGGIFRLMSNGSTNTEYATIVHMCCILRNLYEAIEICQQSGLIPEEKEYRMLITCGDNLGYFINPGDQKRNIDAFIMFDADVLGLTGKCASLMFEELAPTLLKINSLPGSHDHTISPLSIKEGHKTPMTLSQALELLQVTTLPFPPEEHPRFLEDLERAVKYDGEQSVRANASWLLNTWDFYKDF